jgi:hypothetical protein
MPIWPNTSPLMPVPSMGNAPKYVRRLIMALLLVVVWFHAHWWIVLATTLMIVAQEIRFAKKDRAARDAAGDDHGNV